MNCPVPAFETSRGLVERLRKAYANYQRLACMPGEMQATRSYAIAEAGLELTEALEVGIPAALVALDESERLERRMELVRRMAVNGPGPDTTEAQTLATIAHFAAKSIEGGEG